jgi:transposase
MKKKRTYGSTDVEKIDPLAIVQLVLTVGCIVAIDVAKTKFVAAIANAAGEVLLLLRFEHPRQTLAFLRVIEALQANKIAPRVVMEPTGTYGDALRYQCHQRGLSVEMMSPKHTHDIAEVIDGVPSMHDPKAAVALARLAVIRPAGRVWAPDSNEKREMRALLDRRWTLSKTHDLYHGHLEAMLARHWPELGAHLDVRTQRSWMALLQRDPGPHPVASAGDATTKILRAASRGKLSAECIQGIIDSAHATLGVPMTQGEQAKLQFIVEEIERQTRGLDAIDEQIAQGVATDPVMSRIAVVVGPACAASILSHVGSPTAFATASALEKAIGFNLKIKSSGEAAGHLHITKRGPAQVRQMIYLAVLRLVQTDPITNAWYRARTSYTSTTKQKALVAVARKLTRALWHVAKGETFDASRLFDVRRLDVKPLGKPFEAKHVENNTTPTTAPPTRASSLPKQQQQGGRSQPNA